MEVRWYFLFSGVLMLMISDLRPAYILTKLNDLWDLFEEYLLEIAGPPERVRWLV